MHASQKAQSPASDHKRPMHLTERKSQQARTEEREADRRQGQESVRDNIVVAHDYTYHFDARPNLLKLSESPGRNRHFKSQPEKRVNHPSLWLVKAQALER